MQKTEQDFSYILDWVPDKSHVLDLGCGEGQLLSYLKEKKDITGYGLEIDADCIAACLQKGMSVIEQDFDLGLSNFGDNTFDLVMLTATLNASRRPDELIREMLRIGKQALISFPNFSHWSHRLILMWSGKMPVSSIIPHTWYDTPNIHLCAVRDFEQLCEEEKIKIVRRTVQGKIQFLASFRPNFWASQANYLLERP